MTKLEKKDFWAGVGLLIFALFLISYLIPFHVEQELASSLSPRFFPYFSSIVLGILSLLFCLQTWLKSKKNRNTKKTVLSDKNVTGNNNVQQQINLWTPWAGVVILSIYFYLFDVLGFLYATPVCLMALMLLFKQRNPKVMIITSIMVTAALFLLFDKALKVPLS